MITGVACQIHERLQWPSLQNTDREAANFSLTKDIFLVLFSPQRFYLTAIEKFQRNQTTYDITQVAQRWKN